MQSNINSRVLWPATATLLRSTTTGQVYQVRNHVKMYPWRRLRTVRECYLDNTRTPYTDKHNMNEFTHNKQRLKPWMEAKSKNKINDYNGYAWNENYTSDPKEAKETATSRLERFQQSLRDRGNARECKSYNPPDHVDERIISIYKEMVINQDGTMRDHTNRDDITSVDLDQSKTFKFRFIARCIETFEHDMPGSYLNDVKRIADVIDYFSTSVRGVNPYESLMKIDLPPNLTFLAEPDRYDKESDTAFKGLNAMPGIISKVPGLRAKKKYPILNQDEFQWPDI